MTLPGEPKIRINPSESERVSLREWLEIEEGPDGFVLVSHVALGNKQNITRSSDPWALKLHRRDLCALGDYIAAYLWKPGDDEAEVSGQVMAADETQSLGDA